ncbi:MAG: radical SAM protein [Candidatus Omnitrophica bacterium]|nr:radical SAM protein [Candidatus Omnitrophota bacterium]
MAKQSAFKEVKKFSIYYKFNAPYLLYRTKWNMAPRLKWVTKFPIHIDIESTNMCNLKCVMCPHGFENEEYQREFRKTLGIMNWDLYKDIIDEGSKKGLKSIKLNWRGEPLMAKDFLLKAIKYARSKGILEISINTNGLLLNKDFSRNLINSGLDRIIFSVDGASKKTYEKIRRGGNFEKLIDNINIFLAIRNKLNMKRPYVRVQMVKMSENLNEVDNFLDMWKDKVDSITFQDYTNRGESAERLIEKSSYSGRFPCPQIWQRIVIAWDGNVIMCCRDWDSLNKLGKLDYSYGKDIGYFWKGPELTRIRDMHRKRELSKIEACAKCAFKETFNWKI